MELRSLFITDAHKGILKTLEAGGGWGRMGICKDKFSIKTIDNRMQSEETQAKKNQQPTINWLLSSRSDSLAQAF